MVGRKTVVLENEKHGERNMNTKKQNKSGFTLVELMVVAIIVAILAAVAIPLMSGNKDRAMATEGEAGLGTMVTALRIYKAEYDRYPQAPGSSVAAAGSAGALPGIRAGDLDGQYFDGADYTYACSSPSNYTVTVLGGGASGRGGDAGKTSGMTVSLDDQGLWTRSY